MSTAEKTSQSIPKRSEIAIEDTWNLSRLYENDAAWEKDFKKLESLIPGYRERKGTLGKSAEALAAFLEFDRDFDLLLERLNHFASLRTAEDGSDDTYLQREARLGNLVTRAAEAASFFAPELQAISDPDFDRFMADPALAEWKIMLSKIRRYKPHVLSEAEERLLALGGSALGGYGEAFGQLTNVDMRFGTIQDEQGREVELSHGAYSSFLVKRDPALRRQAFHQYYQEFDDHKFTMAATLAHSVKVGVFSARARNYESARRKALFADNVPDVICDRLIESVRQRVDVVSDYYRLRREFLGLDELHAYDTYVPLVPDLDVRTSFESACEMVLESLHPLGDEYVAILGDGFRNRWVDRYETKGKQSGAFSSSSYGNPPYILMNYKEDVFSDIFTLTHEAGHSMHSWYSQKNQPYQDYQYPIFLAEVASTFNEELLIHHLLEKTDDPKMRAYIINRQIDDIRGTVIRQTMFAEFEHVIHALEEAGEALTLEVFRREYRKLLEAYHGPELVIDDALSLECLRIPHFYRAFYVYKYATGLSAAVTLARKVLTAGEGTPPPSGHLPYPQPVGAGEDNPSAPAAAGPPLLSLRAGEEMRLRYLSFLSAGGSKYPLDTLREAGVDMTTPEPVDVTLDLFKSRVAELRELLSSL